MPSYPIDSHRQPTTGTGIVEPVMEWEEGPDGKRKPSKTKQARHEATGMPLWGVEVLYVSSSFGRKSTVAAKVEVGHEEEPKPAPMTPIGFVGLRVEVRPNKSGGFVEYWSAEALMESSRGAGRANTGASGSGSDGKAA